MEKLTYKSSGVDTLKGEETVKKIKEHVKNTYDDRVIAGVGGFSSIYSIANMNIKNPVLVSGTDGVGTKLKLAHLANKHDTVGIDLVAMCVNDILCSGAKPLFFLDYIATGKLDEDIVCDIIKGIADGCKESECSLIGGETAEMPGFYNNEEYDLAGFSVGIADKDNITNIENVKEGNVLIGIASSGLHSNGFSLVRKVILEKAGLDINEYSKELNKTYKEELLTPTKIYVKSVLKVLETVKVNSMVHVTGGGFYENIPRAIKKNQGVVIDKSSYEIPKIFKHIQNLGNIEEKEMYKTFNMGIGFIIICDQTKEKNVIDILNNCGEKAMKIGHVKNGQGVEFC